MFYSVGQAGIGQMSWMRMPPSMLGKIITITRNGRSEQAIFTTSDMLMVYSCHNTLQTKLFNDTTTFSTVKGYRKLY
jgi:hypothetical protein